MLTPDEYYDDDRKTYYVYDYGFINLTQEAKNLASIPQALNLFIV